ncbi:FxSxx-COOH system tetratricopeptide repeat protein [Streptomyces sp. NBC_01571]|uniref:FxSxx-COOH system tetratricopeptide repeat protein n=1 Tax=Streptomyces sp. NBC_01571 TaxID=2975883 RepID=UPI0022570944|nr:FxSxx-COOH system tetratricopeptide repeat protein [Streptomyces sp. NBC_01571]MCX4580685.1 FxSxx-COOH system tetratricopeptide repeat protein [Streptomyces sp. NBC_01571]
MTNTGAATASEGGLAVTGYLAVDRFILQAAPRAPAAWPHQVGVIPPRALSFQHRSEVDQLRAAVDSGGTAVLAQVLTGTGGVGKTQLAADYARTTWDSGEVDVLVWISASSRSAIAAGYAQAGAEVLAADPSDPEQAARAFLAWLEPKADQRQCRWLIVLDDLADPADMRGWWPPTSRHGRALVTTRRREAALTGAGRRRVTVGVFTPQEAAAYLTAVLAAHDRNEPTDQINSLAADLGYLPLALAQAAAYIIDADLTCASYRELLADRIRKLADLLPESGALPDDQTATVAATWSLSIERANRIRPAGLARPMLQLAAFLSPDGIPATVLTSQPALAHITEHHTPTSTGGTHQPVPVSAEDAELALRTLHRLSLIDHTPEAPHPAVLVHQLIQRATRDTLVPHQYDRTARTAADALVFAWPATEREADLAQTFRSNAEALTACAEDALHRPDAHRLYQRVGESLGNSGQVRAAVRHFQRLADTATRLLGSDHPDTLSIRAHLAEWQGRAGDAAGAAASLERLNDALGQIFGTDHPGVFATRHNHAYWLGEAGDAAGAASAMEQLLRDEIRVLGPDHPGVLATRESIATWQGKLGDGAGAKAVYEQLLQDQLRVLGPAHPRLLITRGNLAYWQVKAGDVAGAATAFAELLEDYMRVLGPDHPDTLTARNNLALCRREEGDAAGAATAFAELLEDRERMLGPDHPDTLVTRNNLALCRREEGDAAGAATAFAELLEDYMRVLGPDHPDTLTARNNLALCRREEEERPAPRPIDEQDR